MPPDVHPDDPSFKIVQTADEKFKKAEFRDRVRAMHEAKTPLVKMTKDLELPLDDDVKAILEGLSKSDVEDIRAATIAMLDGGGPFALPLDCKVTLEDAKKPKQIEVEVKNKKKIHVRRKK